MVKRVEESQKEKGIFIKHFRILLTIIIGKQYGREEMKDKKKKWETKIKSLQGKTETMKDDLNAAKITNAMLEGQVALLKWQLGQK